MATFGKTNIGGAAGGTVGNVVIYNSRVVAQGGIIRTIHFYSVLNGNARVAIYKGVNRATANLVVESGSEVCVAGVWHIFDVVDAPFTAGTFHNALQFTVNNMTARDVVVGGAYYRAWAYGAFPDPFGAGFVADVEGSLYTTYTPLVGAGRWPLHRTFTLVI